MSTPKTFKKKTKKLSIGPLISLIQLYLWASTPMESVISVLPGEVLKGPSTDTWLLFFPIVFCCFNLARVVLVLVGCFWFDGFFVFTCVVFTCFSLFRCFFIRFFDCSSFWVISFVGDLLWWASRANPRTPWWNRVSSAKPGGGENRFSGKF